MEYMIVYADRWQGLDCSAPVEGWEQEKNPSWLQLQMEANFLSCINECISCNAYCYSQQQNFHVQFSDMKYFNWEYQWAVTIQFQKKKKKAKKAVSLAM